MVFPRVAAAPRSPSTGRAAGALGEWPETVLTRGTVRTATRSMAATPGRQVVARIAVRARTRVQAETGKAPAAAVGRQTVGVAPAAALRNPTVARAEVAAVGE